MGNTFFRGDYYIRGAHEKELHDLQAFKTWVWAEYGQASLQ
jgi:hypothetical protein